MSEHVKLAVVSDLSEMAVETAVEAAVEAALEAPPEISREQLVKKLHVGEKLAAARAQQELSVDQIAGQLKWSVRQIVEIESGNYAVFPDMLTVRGFVRTYAKFLKVDPALLMQELESEFENLPVKPVDRPQLDTPFHSGRLPWINKQTDSAHYTVYAGFLLILFLIAVFVYRSEIRYAVRGLQSSSSENVKPSPQLSAVSPNYPLENKNEDQAVTTTEVGAETKLQAQTDIQQSTPSVERNAVQQKRSSSEQYPAPSTAQKSSKEPESGNALNTIPKPIVQGQQAAVAPSSPVDLANALVLNFNQDSWVQIKRLNGTIVASHLYKAGTEEVINVDEPMNVVIGNGPGIVAKLRGQKLELPTQVGNNVVYLSVK